MTTGFIDDCIRRARNHDSGIDASVLEVPGFSTGVMRRLWNNLCAEAHNYLEVGAYFGGTACAAINNNPHLQATIFENGSQEFHGRPIIEELKGNLRRHGESWWLDERDFFDVDSSKLPLIDFYFYDGNHDYEWQQRALPHAFPSLARQFLFAVDDFNWNSVRLGTEAGFDTLMGPFIVATQQDCEDMSVLRGQQVIPPGFEYRETPAMKIVHSWHLRGQKPQDDPVFHNGVALFLCEKI